ncbi:hypothetical protein [Lentzea sp. NBRC 102530]|uniref:hypothetical protein n=1 Tax=Lentzea sp. NBRC 102530 TaxID=3032201 RepID=UPI0024A33AA2|nr:hypothetical protein [Lentzea sp. NBRC 102530]GLY47694.1 hypothetical protein Lesp01_13500 [Lentzea sp. NBRC 102530]
MKLVPLQWAALVVVVLDAVVVLSSFATGSPLLPRSANLVLTVISLALMVAAVFLTRGGFNFDDPTLPAWAVAVAVVALLGGALLFALPLLTGTTAGSLEQDPAVLAANQRGWAGLAAAFAGGTVLYAGVRHPK